MSTAADRRQHARVAVPQPLELRRRPRTFRPAASSATTASRRCPSTYAAASPASASRSMGRSSSCGRRFAAARPAPAVGRAELDAGCASGRQHDSVSVSAAGQTVPIRTTTASSAPRPLPAPAAARGQPVSGTSLTADPGQWSGGPRAELRSSAGRTHSTGRGRRSATCRRPAGPRSAAARRSWAQAALGSARRGREWPGLDRNGLARSGDRNGVVADVQMRSLRRVEHSDGEEPLAQGLAAAKRRPQDDDLPIDRDAETAVGRGAYVDGHRRLAVVGNLAAGRKVETAGGEASRRAEEPQPARVRVDLQAVDDPMADVAHLKHRDVRLRGTWPRSRRCGREHERHR